MEPIVIPILIIIIWLCLTGPKSKKRSIIMNDELKYVSDNELKAELARRAKAAKPKMIAHRDRDLFPLIKACEEYVDYIDKYNSDGGSDPSHYIFEAALTCFYGKDIWAWHNSKLT